MEYAESGLACLVARHVSQESLIRENLSDSHQPVASLKVSNSVLQVFALTLNPRLEEFFQETLVSVPYQVGDELSKQLSFAMRKEFLAQGAQPESNFGSAGTASAQDRPHDQAEASKCLHMVTQRLPSERDLFLKVGQSSSPFVLKALQDQPLALSKSWAKD